MSATLHDKLRLFDPELPLERARTIPRCWYTDADVYDAECRAVFGDSWLTVGRADQVTEPGAFVTAEVAGEPVVVVRGDDGALRAFYNVCRHRAARVACQAEGRAARLRCRYHGWTYDLSGRLRGVPEFDGVADFRREDNGLAPLAVAAWGPLVFVHLGKQPGPLEQFLAPLPERTAGLGVERLRFAERREYDIACNWKVFVDNYLDGGYHINTIHPGLAGILDYTQYHNVIAGNTSVQVGPLRPAESQRGDEVGKVRTGANAYYWWLFPNLMINLYEGVMDTNLVLPLGPGRCKVIFDFYFADTEGEAATKFIADSVAVSHQIQLEDLEISEDVQRGLNSRSFDAGRFSVKREGPGYYFHQLLARRLRSV